jgi:peptidyl-prolyl cis-trans isomerase B (cyclophilin B)
MDHRETIASRRRLLAIVLLAAFFIMFALLFTDNQELVADNKASAILETNMGNIVIELEKEKAPISTKNFIQYVKDGYYDGTVFHRVIDGFMIQGGGMTSDMKEKPTRDPIQNEADNGLKNLKYTVAMARTPDPHSASAQFFINVGDNPALDHRNKTPIGWGYAVFGKVVEGQDVVDKIKMVKTGDKGNHQNVPIEPVVIEKASIVE